MIRRPLGHIRRDLRALLGTLGLAHQMGDAELVAYFVREVKALEGELDFNRYGRTDVREAAQVPGPRKVA